MRTTLDLNEKLMTELVRVSGRKSKTSAIEEAARDYIRRRGREAMIARAGKLRLKDVSKRLRSLEKREA